MRRVSPAVLLATCLGFPGPAAAADDTAADVVTLRDGTAVRGEVVQTTQAGPLSLHVRRAWARAHAREWSDRWEKAEAPATARALTRRRQRLESWRRDRAASPVAASSDRITPWIDRELKRSGDDAPGARAPVMLVTLARNDVRTVARSPRGHARLLRLGWVSGFADPEGMKVGDLKEALEGRGYDVASKTPVSIEALTPPQPEADSAWLVRRAATEVLYDPGLRFVRQQGVVFPEPEPGQPLDAATALSGLSALKDLLGDNPTDPLAARLRDVDARGRVGALVTQLDVAPDLSVVTVEIALWARKGADRWSVSGSQSVRVRPDDLGPGAGKELADDPQVAAAFRVVEALGLGEVPAGLKGRSLAVGAATRKALGQARSAAQADLSALALPVLDAPVEKPVPPDRP